MTVISIKDTSEGYALEVKGHSGYAQAGQDIVCAGISTLTFTLMQVLRDNDVLDYYCLQDDGYIFLSFTKRYGNELEEALNVINTGVSMMADSYPEYVSVMS